MQKLSFGGGLATNTFVNGFELSQQYDRQQRNERFVETLNRRIDARSNAEQESF